MTKNTQEMIVTNKMVLAIAVPMSVSFLTVPLLGIVDTAIVGQFGDAALIAGLAVGAVIFDIVFTTFNFLRTGTTGLVAQALGRNNQTEQQAIFWRAMLMAIVIGLVLLPLSPAISWLGLLLIDPASEVRMAAITYITIRFIGAPFTLINYAILGMLLGQNRAMANLAVQSLVNGFNIVLSIFLGIWLNWNIAGVAWATVIAEATIALGAFYWLWRGFDRSHAPSKSQIFDGAAFAKMTRVNRDIMIRSFALLAAFFLFTRFGSDLGTVTLASNAILMNFFLFAAYFLDGISAASEQLAGRAVGAGAKTAFWQVVRKTNLMSFALSTIAALIILLAGPSVVDLMTTAENVRSAARQYIWWAALTPLAGVLAFNMDGIYLGATWSVDMRNMMLLSLSVFVILGLSLPVYFGNHGLWLALNAWLLLRGVSLFYILPKRAEEIGAS